MSLDQLIAHGTTGAFAAGCTRMGEMAQSYLELLEDKIKDVLVSSNTGTIEEV